MAFCGEFGMCLYAVTCYRFWRLTLAPQSGPSAPAPAGPRLASVCTTYVIRVMRYDINTAMALKHRTHVDGCHGNHAPSKQPREITLICEMTRCTLDCAHADWSCLLQPKKKHFFRSFFKGKTVYKLSKYKFTMQNKCFSFYTIRGKLQ